MNNEPEVYKYYSTQRPVDIGTFPKTQGGPVEIESFDKRISVEGDAILAWGALYYTAPLTVKQMSDYELYASPGNPDQPRVTPEQMESHAQIIGQWEQSKCIPDVRRLTWWYSDFGVFVKKEFVPNVQLLKRSDEITDHQRTRSAALR